MVYHAGFAVHPGGEVKVMRDGMDVCLGGLGVSGLRGIQIIVIPGQRETSVE